MSIYMDEFSRLTRLDEDEDDWECGVCEEWFVSHQSLEDHRLYFQHWGSDTNILHSPFIL